jgi:hypothetical protein
MKRHPHHLHLDVEQAMNVRIQCKQLLEIVQVAMRAFAPAPEL